MIPPQFPQLHFAANGAILLHSTADTVTAWDVATRQLRYRCAGRLIGVSQSGVTFATDTRTGEFSLWQSITGELQPPTSAVAADLPFEVRYRVHLEKVGNGRYQGQWLDILGERPSIPIQVQTSGLAAVENLDNWLIISPQRWLAAAWSWADEYVDGAYGGYHALNGDLPERVSLTVSRYHTTPPMYFSRQHDWLVTGEQTGFNIYTATTGQPFGGQAGKYYLRDGGGDVVAFHPTQKMQLAVNQTTILSEDAAKQGFLLLDIQASGRATVLHFLPEPAPVTALAFHPQGNWIAALLSNSAIHLWESDSGQQISSLINENRSAGSGEFTNQTRRIS